MIENIIDNLDQEQIIKKYLKNILVIGITFFICSVLALIKLNEINLKIDRNIISTIRNINCFMVFLTTITLGIYYYGSKETGIFLIAIFYYCLFIENIIHLYFFVVKEEEFIQLINRSGLREPFILNTILRGILLIIACYVSEKNIKIKKVHRKIIIFLVTVTVVITSLLEIELLIPTFNQVSEQVKLTFCVLIFILYVVACILLFYIGLTKNQIIYSLIINSVSLILIKSIYGFVATPQNTILIFIGTIFYFLAFVLPLIGLGFDLTFKIFKNEKLEKELKTFYSLTEDNRDNGVVIYTNKDLIYANKIARKDFNIDLKDIPIKNIDFRKYVKNEELLSNIKNSLQKSCFWSDVIEFNWEKIQFINANVQCIEDEKNNKKYCIMYRNISKEHIISNKLKISEEKMRTINSNIKDLISSTDKIGKIQYLSPSITKILGYDYTELIGYNWFSLVHPLDVTSVRKVLGDYEDNDTVITEHRIRTKSGKYVWVESVSNLLKREDGTIIGKVIISRDISYRNEMEKLKVEVNEAKEYEKIRGEFFANLSHELRTPINIIYSCIQLLDYHKGSKDSLSEYYDKYEKTIKQNCFRMLRLVNNLIDITKIDSGFMKFDFGNYDIVKIVEDITLSVIPYVEVKNIEMIFDTEFEERIIKCDPDKIERIILNLLSNSIKFTDIGGKIYVNISYKKGFVEINVTDNGKGIPIDKRKTVFERFVQADKSLKRGQEGSGIGLALVKSLVELHNGKIYLDEERPNGTKITILLPDIITEETDDENVNYELYKPNIDRISVEFSDIYELY
ncbi:PAS/PAC sensor signal transduction histidine kinase [Clostridium cavendishii DSM 21758]|uniref:histidine kinase n=1 Tax=Clostridium cavendishii DSM 21758 TaxID=1121302 RepID=A0A1M6MQW6_9CLOT|nr:ATP-binding protein [Clostridium cavendishii]SHJ85673.1 PAS/PAC sensor signal transduction histidine kinase [Clostridium cavendishii DSM 21758]